MRYLTRSLGVGLTAAWLISGSAAQAQLGGSGGSSSGGGSSGGRSSGGGGSGGGGQGQVGGGSTQPMTIGGTSLLGSFDNIGTGTSGRSGAGGVSQSNLFAPYYVNPIAQGLVTGTGQSRATVSSSTFGQPVFSNLMSSNTVNGAGSGNRSSFGSTSMGSTGGRSSTGTGFGGTSTGGTASFGSTGMSSGSTGFGGGGSTGFGGTMGGTTGGRSTGSAGGRGTTFAGANIAPSIGRTGPSVTASLQFPVSPRLAVERRGDLQGVIARSTTFTAPANVAITMDSGVVVLRGTVGTSNDRRLAENMLRLQPGVREIRNELDVRNP